MKGNALWSQITLSRSDLVSLRLFAAVVDAAPTRGERFGISLAAASRRISELGA
jgi:hypothetical protein